MPVCECVFHSGRLRYAFPPNDICALAPKELRIRPEGVTHSPRMIYAFAPKVLRILPEGVTHSPRRCYAFVWANKIRTFVLLGRALQETVLRPHELVQKRRLQNTAPRCPHTSGRRASTLSQESSGRSSGGPLHTERGAVAVICVSLRNFSSRTISTTPPT